MKIEIVNHYFQIYGKKYYFCSLQEALDSLKLNHKDIFDQLIDPFKYIQELKQSISLELTNNIEDLPTPQDKNILHINHKTTANDVRNFFIWKLKKE